MAHVSWIKAKSDSVRLKYFILDLVSCSFGMTDVSIYGKLCLA